MVDEESVPTQLPKGENSDVDDEERHYIRMVNSQSRPAMRHSRPKDESYLHNSTSKFRLFNIFHPRDPVVRSQVKALIKYDSSRFYQIGLSAVLGLSLRTAHFKALREYSTSCYWQSKASKGPRSP